MALTELDDKGRRVPSPVLMAWLQAAVFAVVIPGMLFLVGLHTRVVAIEANRFTSGQALELTNGFADALRTHAEIPGHAVMIERVDQGFEHILDEITEMKEEIRALNERLRRP